MEKKIENKEARQSVLDYIEGTKNAASDYSNLLAKFESIAKHNDELTARISEMETDVVAMKDCLICHEKFSPLMNTTVRRE